MSMSTTGVRQTALEKRRLLYQDRTANNHRTAWCVPLRLTSFVVLFSVAVFWMKDPAFLHLWLILYGILTLAATLLLVLGRRLCLTNVTSLVIALQLAAEIALEAGIIYTTGNVHSPFSALFILTIVSAALSYRLVGTLVVASLVSLAYTFIIWLGLSDPGSPDVSLRALQTIFSAQETIFYAIFLHLLIFYLVAFTSGYLAERIRLQDRRLAETSRALRRAQLETDDILRHLNSGLLTIDATGHIIFFNRAAERILDYREEQVKGMLCHDAFAERLPEFAERLMDGVRHGQTYPRTEIEMAGPKGEPVPLGISTSLLTDETHRLRGVIAIFSDLTQAKQLETRVRTADRLAAIGELSASIAHEIRNPLASISGSVQVLREAVDVSGDNARLMDLIVKESERLSRISTDFLLYARIAGPALTKVELCHTISEVIQILHNDRCFSPDVDLGFESEESIVYVVGDADLIKQLLLNLAVNACEAFEGGEGEVVFRITVDARSDTVTVSVTDNGPGMAPEHVRRIYEPFFSTKRQGTGLGLAIVHRIVSAMKLHLDLNTHVGEGTEFRIEFKRYGVGDPAAAESRRTSPLGA